MMFRMIAQLWNTNTPVIVSCDADLTENYMYISMKFRTGVHVFWWEVGVFNRSCFQSVSCKRGHGHRLYGTCIVYIYIKYTSVYKFLVCLFQVDIQVIKISIKFEIEEEIMQKSLQTMKFIVVAVYAIIIPHYQCQGKEQGSFAFVFRFCLNMQDRKYIAPRCTRPCPLSLIVVTS